VTKAWCVEVDPLLKMTAAIARIVCRFRPTVCGPDINVRTHKLRIREGPRRGKCVGKIATGSVRRGAEGRSNQWPTMSRTTSFTLLESTTNSRGLSRAEKALTPQNCRTSTQNADPDYERPNERRTLRLWLYWGSRRSAHLSNNSKKETLLLQGLSLLFRHELVFSL
jgi:hypothetical protein